jgi:hypothetical protein
MASELAEAAQARVPALIADAGDQAIAAYRAYLEAPGCTARTRRNYRGEIVRFSRWANERGLTLAAITVADASTYAASLAAVKSPQSVAVALTPLRGLFHQLTESGVIADDPFTSQRRSGRFDRSAEPPKPLADAEFPLLSLMAMLAHMEEQSLQRVLTEESPARKLLEFVRWRDGRLCTHCGAPGEDVEEVSEAVGREFHCPACGRRYAVTDASPFENLPMPLQDGLFLLFRLFLYDERQQGTETPSLRRDIDNATVRQLAVRIGEALARQGLPAAGEGLRRAIDGRNRELEQDEIARGIIECAELDAARTALLKAQAEGAAVDDLPPGMTPDEAVATLDARLAEHDRYMIALKDGYLAYHWPETGESVEAERPAAPPADAQVASDGH